jgi:hypothetical protein
MNICIITALPFEAKNLIKSLNLQQVKFFLPLYQKDNISLCIIGSGKIKMQKAIELLTKKINSPTWWINFGIAGHKDKKLGEIFEISEVINTPHNIKLEKLSDLPLFNIKTLNEPTTTYENDFIYDMEALYFYQGINNEQDKISIFKIISDNQKNPIQALTKNKAMNLINKQIHKIVALIESQ